MKFIKMGLPVALVALSGSASAALVNLSGWTAEGGASNWTVAADKNSVFQSVNGSPAVFFSGSNDQGKALSGKIRVETTSDDDYIGFVLGYNSGEATAAATDFILIDWKQTNQSFYGCQGLAGLAISRVSAGLPDSAVTWCHSGSITELARATTLGSIGWADNTEYAFDLVFTATNIQVKVNGATELNVDGTFGDGSFGFYNYSQQSVRYSALQEDIVPDPDNTVPEPSSLALLGFGLFAAAGLRKRSQR
ncbi:MAG: PEP-CTERM sorting domain-containing protein [Rhodocyclaceae bacterium]|nr:PEP-CTERM sorting domain-containing protein [Rhodocyclaceae bacterium]